MFNTIQNSVFALDEENPVDRIAELIAAFLGISPAALYGWVSQRKIAFVKVGRLTKFRPEDLTQWLERRRTEEDRRDFLV